MNSISKDLVVHTFPCLSDNYGFLIHDPVSKQTATVDTPDAKAIDRELKKQGWQLDYIFNTHHHHDHVGGNLELKQQYHCKIFASEYDQNRIPGIDVTLNEGDTVSLGDHIANIYETPGHTLGHIIYHFAQQNLLFVGDTLFALGCGRLFEGTAEQMFNSLAKIKTMPDDTIVHCAHEYTEANAEFALSLKQANPAFDERYEEIKHLRIENQPTVPFELIKDKQTNPFLLATTDNKFAEYRKLKDNF